jgi:hypothetical protein
LVKDHDVHILLTLLVKLSIGNDITPEEIKKFDEIESSSVPSTLLIIRKSIRRYLDLLTKD